MLVTLAAVAAFFVALVPKPSGDTAKQDAEKKAPEAGQAGSSEGTEQAAAQPGPLGPVWDIAGQTPRCDPRESGERAL